MRAVEAATIEAASAVMRTKMPWAGRLILPGIWFAGSLSQWCVR